MSTLFSGHYLRNRSTLDIGVLGYIGIVQHKEHSPEILSIPPGTPCIFTLPETLIGLFCVMFLKTFFFSLPTFEFDLLSLWFPKIT